jgi:hypothetical protein
LRWRSRSSSSRLISTPPAFVFASEAFSASSSSWNSRRFPVSSWRTGSVDSFIGGGAS